MGRRGAVRVGLVAGLVAGALTLGGCAGQATSPIVTNPPGGDRTAPGLQLGSGTHLAPALDDVPAVPGVVAATWRAGVAALRASDEPTGAVVSPASLMIALSMLAEGATGDSAATFDEVLGAAGDERTAAVAALTTALARLQDEPAMMRMDGLPEPPMVHMANQVVVDDEQRIAEPFLDHLMTGYGAGVLVADLSSDAGKKVLDHWVDEHSGGLVKESAIQPMPDLVMVLQNAVAFAAAWDAPFQGYDTSDASFALPTGERADVPTMHQAGWFAYAEVDGWRAVRLPYAPGTGSDAAGVHADVVLPPDGSPSAADPASVDPQTLSAIAAALDRAEPTDVELALPKVDLTSKVDLVAALETLGLGHLLHSSTAGLEGLLVDPPEPPYVGQAWQQAVLKVDEEGTRAAAVTEVGVRAGSAPAQDLVRFVVDRPYLFVVGDRVAGGWPLFLAAVLDPRG